MCVRHRTRASNGLCVRHRTHASNGLCVRRRTRASNGLRARRRALVSNGLHGRHRTLVSNGLCARCVGPKGRRWPRVIEHPRLYFEICSIVHMAQTDSTEKERMRVGGKRKPGKRSRPQEHEAWRLRMRAVMYNGVASIVCVVCRRLVTGLREASCICCSWLPGVCVSVNLALLRKPHLTTTTQETTDLWAEGVL